MILKTKLCSSLTKVMPGTEPGLEIRSGTALRGERFAFQVAFHADSRSTLYVKLESELKKAIRIRQVGLVPVEYTGPEHDDDIVSKEPGMYPDVLTGLTDSWAYALPGQWRSLWITVDVPKNCKPGKYDITLKLANGGWSFKTKVEEEILKPVSFTLEVLNAVLPEQRLKNTHWFHTDCLATYYRVDVFSEEYWRIVGNFMRNAADHGINLILTPIFTPPLDTMQGAERPTVQLVGVKLTKKKYSFDFTLLERWIALAKKSGIRYFEISHLFTQWGAKFTPKIMANVDGKEKRIFGWDVSSTSKEYKEFLDAFLPALVRFLKKNKLQDKVYFHCSDEPSLEALENYTACRNLLKKHLEGFKIMDALSNLEFYKNGVVDIPVPSEVHLEDFLKVGMKENWTYYCCGPVTVFSNRFIYMTSSRNRIFGTLLYCHDVEGFLHWGYNFYYAGLSRFPIDPYRCTDSDFFFPAGDAFLVYPGKDGVPEDSIRHEVFYEGLQDQRALQLLETKLGRAKLQKELDKLSPDGEMTISKYPKGEKNVLAVREKINRLIKANFK